MLRKSREGPQWTVLHGSLMTRTVVYWKIVFIDMNSRMYNRALDDIDFKLNIVYCPCRTIPIVCDSPAICIWFGCDLAGIRPLTQYVQKNSNSS